MTIPIGKQIAEVRREIALRRNVYKRLVAQGKLSERQAAEKIAIMEAVLESLRKVEEDRNARDPLGEALNMGDGTYRP